MKTQNLQYFPPAKQQGLRDTCQFNGLAAICEALWNRAGNSPVDRSRLYPLKETQKRIGFPDSIIPAMADVVVTAQTQGLPPEWAHAYFDGYNMADPSAQAHALAAEAKLGDHFTIPLDAYNYTANAYQVRAALEQGWLVGIGFKRRRFYDYLSTKPEAEHLPYAATVMPGSWEHTHTVNHFVAITDFDDSLFGHQGLAFSIRDSGGSFGTDGRDVVWVGPSFMRDAINIEVFKGFAGCNDRHTYDADGIPGQVFRLYQAAFNRTPDKGGLGYQIDAAKNGLPLWQLAMNFMASPEGQQKLPPTLTNAQYVDKLYDNVLHRPGDAGGIAWHLGNLNAGMARHDVLMQFAGSPENKAACAPAFERGVAYT